jgi:predicted nicotinamide N-methyase
LDARRLVLRSTECATPVLCPELRLRLITPRSPLWNASESEAVAQGLIDPYWAFCWAGGQALARFVLDNPTLVSGRHVLDFGAGGGVQGVAAAKAGGHVLAVDVDPLACAAVQLNAELNDVRVETCCRDLIGAPCSGFDVVLAGDVTYDRDMAARVIPWLRQLSDVGATVLISDPGRGFLDPHGLQQVARYHAPTDGDADGTQLRPTHVFLLSRPTASSSTREPQRKDTGCPGASQRTLTIP